jgi:hypothetical protein
MEELLTKAKEAGLVLMVDGGDDQNDSGIGEAMVTFKVGSGASGHYVKGGVQLEDTKSVVHSVRTAHKGTTINVGTKGTFVGSVDGSTAVMSLEARQSEASSHNLFSVREAVRSGHTVTFAPCGSMVTASDGTQVPLEATMSGWDLNMQSMGEAHDMEGFTLTPPDAAPTAREDISPEDSM